MKDKVNQLFKDKLILVTLVLGLLTIVATAGVVTIRRGNEPLDESPYLEIKEPGGLIVGEVDDASIAGDSNAAQAAEHEGTGDEAGNHGETYAADSEKSAGGSTGGGSGAGNGSGSQADALEAGAIVSESLVLDFTETEKLMWPVMGNVILSYSMDTTTWFPTLEQYKCNPANVIQSDVSTPVSAPADAKILEIGHHEEIGNYIWMDLGNDYTAICGQLKEIPVVINEYVHKGDLLGYVAEPTKYYSVEGVNVYFEFLHNGQPIDALNYLE